MQTTRRAPVRQTVLSDDDDIAAATAAFERHLALAPIERLRRATLEASVIAGRVIRGDATLDDLRAARREVTAAFARLGRTP